MIRIPEPRKDLRGEAVAVGSGLAGEVARGLRYLAGQPGHLALLLVAALVNLALTPAFALLPLRIAEEGGGASALGFASSAFGVGTLAGGILLATWGGFRRRMRTIALGFLGLAIATASLAMLPVEAVLWVSAAMAACGLSAPLVNAPVVTLLQATVQPELQGRVFTLYGSVAGATAPIGLLLAAPIAEAAGVRFSYFAGSLACALVAGFVLVAPTLRRLDREATPSQV